MPDKTPYLDTFARDNLPPRELWPEMDFSVLPELNYAESFNCAAELLDRFVAAGGGDRIVFRGPGGVWRYGKLLEQANRIANVLTGEFGLRPGNRVLLRGPNHPMLAACWFAVVKAGGICVSTMPLLRSRELSYIAEKAEIRLAVCDRRWAGELETARVRTPQLEQVAYFNCEEELKGRPSLEAMAAEMPDTFENVPTRADDVAMIAFTSGTTGQAKGTVHFHRDVMAACDCFPRSTLKAGPDDIFIGTPPLAFTFGLGGLLLFPIRAGASVVLLESATPESLLQAMADEKVTVCFTAPTMFRAMTPLAGDYDLGALTKCVSAGETLPLSVYQGWEAATGVRIIDGLGTTELLHIFIAAAGDDIRPGATGKPIPGYQAQVVDTGGQALPPGTPGLLAVCGATGCRYLDDAERQKKYVQHGWNLTGDLYVMDEDGYFWYQSRADDMIVSAGYNISGAEIEEVLLEHPSVKECGVVGIPDPERGQIVKAFVVLNAPSPDEAATAIELQDFVKREIAPYKYPRAIAFLDALPRTETGKLQRFRLREMG